MSKAEEKALKAYPVLFSERNGYPQTMGLKRLAYELGYEQAEKDLALTPEDVAVICNLVKSASCADWKEKCKVAADAFNESRQADE